MYMFTLAIIFVVYVGIHGRRISQGNRPPGTLTNGSEYMNVCISG